MIKVSLRNFCVVLSLLLIGCQHDRKVFQGYVDADYILLASPFGGPLKELNIKRGEMVEKGTVLFQLDATTQIQSEEKASQDLEQARAIVSNLQKGKRPSEIASVAAKLAQAQADLKLAEDELKRLEELHSKHFLSDDDFNKVTTAAALKKHAVEQSIADLETSHLGGRIDEVAAAEANVRALEAARASARWNLSQQKGISPTRALVFDTLYRPGEYVAPGKPVLSLLAPENLKIRFFVPERERVNTMPGEVAYIRADGRKDEIQAKISYVSPQAEYTPPIIFSVERREKLVYMVEARLESSGNIPLMPGQPVDVSLPSR